METVHQAAARLLDQAPSTDLHLLLDEYVVLFEAHGAELEWELAEQLRSRWTSRWGSSSSAASLAASEFDLEEHAKRLVDTLAGFESFASGDSEYLVQVQDLVRYLYGLTPDLKGGDSTGVLCLLLAALTTPTNKVFDYADVEDYVLDNVSLYRDIPQISARLASGEGFSAQDVQALSQRMRFAQGKSFPPGKRVAILSRYLRFLLADYPSDELAELASRTVDLYGPLFPASIPSVEDLVELLTCVQGGQSISDPDSQLSRMLLERNAGQIESAMSALAAVIHTYSSLPFPHPEYAPARVLAGMQALDGREWGRSLLLEAVAAADRKEAASLRRVSYLLAEYPTRPLFMVVFTLFDRLMRSSLAAGLAPELLAEHLEDHLEELETAPGLDFWSDYFACVDDPSRVLDWQALPLSRMYSVLTACVALLAQDLPDRARLGLVLDDLRRDLLGPDQD